jgi:hypothetical protein
MRLLILEDNQDRIEKFKILFKNQEASFVKTVREAIELVAWYRDFDILWLDHDLGGKIWEDSFKEDTGYHFVKWMVDNELQKKALIYIHSMNPVGANLMLNYLKDNGYDGSCIPFNLIKFEK